MTTIKRRGRPNPLDKDNFQKIFSGEGSEEILLALINAFEVRSDKARDRYHTVTHLENEDSTIPSIHIKAETKGLIGDKNIELQVLKEEYLEGDFNDYWAKIMTNSIKGVGDYSVDGRVEKLYFADFDLFDNNRQYRTVFTLNKLGFGSNLGGGGVTFVFYERPKFEKMSKKKIRAEWTTRDPFLKWLVFLSPSPDPQLLKEAILLDEDIKKAEERLNSK